MNRRDALKSLTALGLIPLGLASHRAALAQEATPAIDQPDSPFEGLLTSNIDALPTADDGEIQIVLQSPAFDEYVGFIIHNNSGQTVGTRDVIGVAREADGTLFGVLRFARVAPYDIGPGEYSIGVASFDRDLEPTTAIELVAEFEDPEEKRRGHVDLTVTEVTIIDNSIIGIVENQTKSATVTLPHLIGLFLDESGEIVGLTRPYLTGSDLAAGSFATFSESMTGGIGTDSFLFAASGREDR